MALPVASHLDPLRKAPPLSNTDEPTGSDSRRAALLRAMIFAGVAPCPYTGTSAAAAGAGAASTEPTADMSAIFTTLRASSPVGLADADLPMAKTATSVAAAAAKHLWKAIDPHTTPERVAVSAAHSAGGAKPTIDKQ